MEIRQLSYTGQEDRRSRLRFLHPQLLDDIIRVGGRLYNACIPIDEKHSMVLPPRYRLTVMIATKEHQKMLHSGPGLLFSPLHRRL